MKHFLIALALVIFWGILTDPAEATIDPATMHSGNISSPIYMTGDSISWRARNDLKPNHWRMDTVPGRPVESLPWSISARLNAGAAPKLVVIELGTNGVNALPNGWAGAQSTYESYYKQAVNMLPNTTKVVFVTPYRDPRVAKVRWLADSPALTYYAARAMVSVAKTRAHTCVVPWRAYASHHRGLLVDGTHPGVAGLKIWTGMINRGVSNCR